MTRSRVLDVDDVTFNYGRKTVLSQVNLSLGTGANVMLGRNGAGKTTLIRVLAGAARPVHGSVRFAGETVGGKGPAGRRALRNIGWLPQVFGYPPHMRAVEFVAYAAWLKEVPREHIVARTEEALAVADLTDRAGHPLRSLSGGQLRRVGLAAALVADPAVLILDEPTAGLDPEQRDGFHGLIREIREKKVVVVATHLLEDVEALAERVFVLDAGSVCWAGTADDLARKAGAEPGLQGLRLGFQTVLRSTR